MSIVPLPELEPVHQPVYETWDSLQAVITAAQQEIDELTPNRLKVLFGIYHNTLLSKLPNH